MRGEALQPYRSARQNRNETPVTPEREGALAPLHLLASVISGSESLDHRVRALVTWAPSEAAREVAQGRIPADRERAFALRLVYQSLRADAAPPRRFEPNQAPRWRLAYEALSCLRHRQRAALASYFCLCCSVREVAYALDVREREAREIIEAGLVALAKVLPGPGDVRRALRAAGAHLTSEPLPAPQSSPPAPVSVAGPARIPRAVVRALLADPVLEFSAKPPAPPPQASPAQAVEDVPRRRRPSPVEMLLAPFEEIPSVAAQAEPIPLRTTPVPDAVPNAEPEPAPVPLPETPVVPVAETVTRPTIAATAAEPAPEPARQVPPVAGRASRTRHWWVAAALVAVMALALNPATAVDHVPEPASRPASSAAVAPEGVRAARVEVPQAIAPAPDLALPRRVRVVPGDSLWRIARQRLGDGTRWREIWQLNKGKAMPRGRVFERPELIHPGWMLRLPPPARQG